FVTCYTSDDIGYITQQAGAGVLMIGTDYGHQDMSVELDALRTLGERGDLAPLIRGGFLKCDIASRLAAYCGMRDNPQPPGGKLCFARPVSTNGSVLSQNICPNSQNAH